MTRIGKNYILKGIFDDGSVAYWARSKNYEYVMDPSNATFFKTKEQAENKAKRLKSKNKLLYSVIVKEVQLMLIP